MQFYLEQTFVSDIQIITRAKRVIKYWQFYGKQIKWRMFSNSLYSNQHKLLLDRMEQIIREITDSATL
jgi:hypothetical protein